MNAIILNCSSECLVCFHNWEYQKVILDSR